MKKVKKILFVCLATCMLSIGNTYSQVGSYDPDNLNADDLYNSYLNLQYSDAVVNSRHTFLITENVSNCHWVFVYEQTPPKAKYTTWTYDQMASGKYLPFTQY